jgi:hypothetical protein
MRVQIETDFRKKFCIETENVQEFYFTWDQIGLFSSDCRLEDLVKKNLYLSIFKLLYTIHIGQ